MTKRDREAVERLLEHLREQQKQTATIFRNVSSRFDDQAIIINKLAEILEKK